MILPQHAQNSRPTGNEFILEKEQRILQNDTTEIGVYVDLASYYKLDLEDKKTGKSSLYMTKALNVARKTDNERFFIQALEKEGVKLRNKGYYQQSLFFHFFANDLLATFRDPALHMRCYNNIGVVYRRIDDYELAIKYHLKALRLADSVGNDHSKAISINSIGNINFLLRDYPKAIEFFEKSLELETQSKSTRGIAINLNNLGNVYLAMNQNEKAREYFRQSLDVNLRAGDLKGTAICYNDLGNVYKAEKSYNQALDYCLKALELFEKVSDLRYIIDTKLNIGQIFMFLGEMAKAERYILEALPDAEKLGALSQLVEINQRLSDLSIRKENPGIALFYFKRSIVFKDSLLNENNRRNIAAIQTRFESETNAKEINFLKQENQIKALNMKRQRIISSSIIAFLFIGALMIYLAYRNKKKREKSLQEKNLIIEKAQKELSRYAAELESAKLNAERLADIKSVFLANMSHEIRTPLNAILGFSDILARNPNSQSVEKYIQAIRHSGKGLLTIINDILDLATIESGKVAIVPTQINLKSFIGEIITAFSLNAEQKGLSLRQEYTTRMPEWLVIDAIRVRQILFNLIGNAIKFTERGSVTIQIGTFNPQANPGDRISFHISVTDTGRGISAENLEIIFDSFSQLNHSASSSRQGTGLGLTISRRLARLMGGHITVNSTPGEGSCFKLVLTGIEIGKGDIIEEDYQAQVLNTAFGKSCVLIVDDVYDNRLLLKELLSIEAIRVVEASGGAEALNLAHTEQPDLILLDIRMPGMDGYEIIRRLKASPSTLNIPVVAVSASVFDADKSAFRNAGFHDFLYKPLQYNELIGVLNNYLPKPEKG